MLQKKYLMLQQQNETTKVKMIPLGAYSFFCCLLKEYKNKAVNSKNSRLKVEGCTIQLLATIFFSVYNKYCYVMVPVYIVFLKKHINRHFCVIIFTLLCIETKTHTNNCIGWSSAFKKIRDSETFVPQYTVLHMPKYRNNIRLGQPAEKYV